MTKHGMDPNGLGPDGWMSGDINVDAWMSGDINVDAWMSGDINVDAWMSGDINVDGNIDFVPRVYKVYVLNGNTEQEVDLSKLPPPHLKS